MSEDRHQIVKPGAAATAAIARRGFGTQELEIRRETASTSMAERVKAEVQAKFIMAMQRPRNMDVVWAKLVKECQRYNFAFSARYLLKKGKKRDANGQFVDNWIEGLSIGFARAALQAMGNIEITEMVTYEDAEKIIVRVSATDMESNACQTRDVSVARAIERSSAKGRQLIGERVNSYGDLTYIVVPTDEEMEAKKAALVSKVRRTLILDLLPADLKDDCLWTIGSTIEAGDKGDPESAKKRMLINYARIGVYADDIEKYIGHAIAQITEAEVGELRKIFQAVNDNETTWATALEEKLEDPDREKPAAGSAIPAPPANDVPAAAEAPSPRQRVRAQADKAREQSTRQDSPPPYDPERDR